MNLHEYLKLKKALGGGVTSWNDLTDKPFYETEEIFEKSVIAPASGQSYGGVVDLEIAQAIFDDYTCATITFFDGTYELDGIRDTYSYEIVYGVKGNDSYEVSVGLTDGKPNGGVSWNRGGYNYAPQAEISVHSVKREIKKLDEKFLPDSVIDIVFTVTNTVDGYVFSCNTPYSEVRKLLLDGCTARLVYRTYEHDSIRHHSIKSVVDNSYSLMLYFLDNDYDDAYYCNIEYAEDGYLGSGRPS